MFDTMDAAPRADRGGLDDVPAVLGFVDRTHQHLLRTEADLLWAAAHYADLCGVDLDEVVGELLASDRHGTP